MLAFRATMGNKKNPSSCIFKKQFDLPEPEKSLQSFNIERQLPIHSAMDKILSKKRREEKKKKPSSPMNAQSLIANPLRCSLSEKTPLFLIDQRKVFLNKQIKDLRVKEQLLAARRLKSIGQHMHAWIQHRLHQQITHQSEQSSKAGEGNVLKHEERHFLIDRVIKYLTDI